MTDELIAAARSGDRAALERLLAGEAGRIYAFGLRMCGDPEDARDVAQDTMLAVANGIGGFRGDASWQTWMFQIARNACSRHRRRASGAPSTLASLDDVEPIDPGPSPEAEAEAGERATRLHGALSRLAPAMREVLVLRDVQGLSAPEVASVLDVSVDAVKSRLHRARAALREALAASDGARPARCPDVLARWSERLEGELPGALCSEIEQHVAHCGRCRELCHALEDSLAECRTLAVAPPGVQARVREALQGALVQLRSTR